MKLLKDLVMIITVNLLLMQAVFATGVELEAAVHHEHHKPVNQNISGEKWQADIHLQQGIKNIEIAMNRALKASHHDSLNKSDAGKLAETIKSEVEAIVVNCKLEPKADAILHVLIHELLAGVDLLQDEQQFSKGLAAISEVLKKYPNHFYSD